MSEKLELDLDPMKVINSLKEMSEETKKLAAVMEDSLGKQSVKAVDDLEVKTEKATSKIGTYFRNLGTRLKEDLKTAFDVGKLLGGLKLADSMASGTRQIFDMERAFDKLNTRLGLTGKTLNAFKTSVGRKVSATGQKLEDILPGVETAAAKGGVKSPAQLTNIAEQLAKARAATGEDTAGLSDSIIEILRAQGKQVTDASFKSTLDAVQGTRVSGAFGSAGEAATAMHNITQGMSPDQMKAMGLNTRGIGGLAAAASKAGAGGQDILNHILQMATQAGGKEQLNAIFGTKLFKNGKLDTGAFQSIDKNHFGKYSEQVLSSATGANQADLSRFLDTMKTGMGDFQKVISGSEETATQFEAATDNLATKIDRFKEGAKEAGREIGESLSVLGKDVLEGHFGKLGEDAKGIGKSMLQNKGTLLGSLGLAAGSALLMGSGAKGLLSKVPGLGGLAGAAAGAGIAKASGVTPVYVVNAGDFGGLGSKITGGAGALLGKFGALGPAAAGVGVAGAAGYAGYAFANTEAGQKLGDKMGLQSIADMFYALNRGEDTDALAQSAQKAQANLDADAMAKAVEKGTHDGTVRSKKSIPVSFTNPSTMPDRGPAH